MFLHSCNAANYSVLSTLIIIDIICFCYFPPRGIQIRDGLEAFDPITINYDHSRFQDCQAKFPFLSNDITGGNFISINIVTGSDPEELSGQELSEQHQHEDKQ